MWGRAIFSGSRRSVNHLIRMLYDASLITSLLCHRACGGRINWPHGAGRSQSSLARDKPVSEFNRLRIRGLRVSSRDQYIKNE